MKLQHELQRPVPFPSAQQELLLNLLRASDQLSNRLCRFFRDRGLTMSRFNVLRSLFLAEGPLTCGEIGDRMIQAVPAVTLLIDHLEEQKLVERQRCTDDRRVIHVRITKAGRKLVDQTMEPLAEIEQGMLAGVSATELKRGICMMEKLRASFTAAVE